MKIQIKFILFLLTLLILFSNFNCILTYAKADKEGGYISLDYKYNDEAPVNLRTTIDLSKIENNDLNLSGLKDLNISGSSQFTELSLSKIKECINSDLPIYIIDLRKESHGFINGDAVSLFTPGNKINASLPLTVVLKREELFIKSIPLNRNINLDVDKYSITPKTTYNEETLVKNNEISYFRIPVNDKNRPTDDMIDRFIIFTKTLPKDKWLHFHCKEGNERTTIFMILYDIMNNYKTVSLDNIINRQVALSSLDSLKFKQHEKYYLLLENFYKYVKETNLDTTWKEWVNSNNIKPFTLAEEKES